MRILVDLDSIVADFFAGIWSEYRRRGGDPKYGTADVTHWDMSKLIPAVPQGTDYPDLTTDDIFKAPGFFSGLPLVPGARAVLKLLHDSGHQVVIVTAHCTDLSAAEKVGWIRNNLPFIPKKQVVITKLKGAINGDVLIDDSPDNCREWKEENPNGLVLTIGYPYNDDPVYGPGGRLGSHEDTEAAWVQIYHSILEWKRVIVGGGEP